MKLAGFIIFIIVFIYFESRYIDLVREIKEYRLIKLKKLHPEFGVDRLKNEFKRDYKGVSGADRIMLILAIVGLCLLVI